MTVLIAPTPFATIVTSSNTTYTADAYGQISVSNLNDISDLESAGCAPQTITQDAEASLTAAGTNQATATVLPTRINIVTTVASGTGVILQAAFMNQRVLVMNRGANALLVYPPVGAALEANSVNAGYSVASGSSNDFIMVSATQGYVH